MRNLKRALSLALAAAMLISLMVVGASAASYGDTDKVNQTEAVDVLTGLGVVGGDQNGNFNPTATLTRAEFCVMIANALNGSTFDPTLFDGTETPFTDVANHWGSSYIAYCYSAGIIAGTSATTFSPDNTLTAAQAAAILLMALGYNQDNEFAANGQFSLNVTRWAQTAGLYEDLSVAANAGISRENTARMIFNALTVATPVEYNHAFGMYNTVGNGLDGVVRGDTAGNYQYTLASKNFNLTKNPTGQTDDFMRPGVTWTYKNETIGFGMADAAYTAVVNTPNKTVADYVTDVMHRDYTYANSGAAVSVNGANAVANTYSLKVGSTVEFYLSNTTANQVTRVVVIEPTVYTLTADAATRVVDGKTQVIVPGVVGMGAYNDDNTSETVVGYQGLKKDDVVLVYKSTQSRDGDSTVVTYITKANSVTGVVTGMQDGDKVVVNGTAYSESGLANKSYSAAGFNDYTNTYTFYLDAANNIVKAVKNTDNATENYAYVLESKWVDYANTGAELGQTNFAQARLLLSDGTNVIVTVDKVGGADAADSNGKVSDGNNGTIDGSFVTYKVNSDSEYELTVQATGALADNSTLTGNKANFNGSYVGNNNTIFLVNTKTASDPSVTVYTGIANVPTINGIADEDKVMVKNGVAQIVYVEVDSTDILGADGQYIYIPGTGKDYDKLSYTYIPESESGKGDDYYLFNAIVNGVAQQVKLDTATGNLVDADGATTADTKVDVNTMYKVVKTDSNGVITLLAGNVSGTIGVEVTGGTLITAGASYKVTGTTEAYYIDHTGAVTELNASDIQKDTTDLVYVTKASDNNNTADCVIVVEVLSGTAKITGITYTIDGKETKVTGLNLTSGHQGIKGLTGMAGKTVTITDVACEEGTWAVDGSAVVNQSSDQADKITVTVTSEDGKATATVTFGFKVDNT